MLAESETINSSREILMNLSELGLNNYEAKVYLSLVSEGASTAKNVNDITGIPYGKVYEVINALCSKGFVTTFPSKPMKFQAISPEKAMENIKEGFAKKCTHMDQFMKNHLEPMFKEGKKFSEPKSVLLVLNGRPNITKKIDELIKNAEKSICVYSSANGIKRLVIHKNLLKEAAARGVNIKIAGVASNDNEEDINLFSFCEFKKIPKAINNLLIIDSKECLVVDPIPDDENIVYGRDFGVIITSSSFTKFLENFFDADFKKAKECKNGNGHKV